MNSETNAGVKGWAEIYNDKGELVLCGEAVIKGDALRGKAWHARFVNEDEHQSFSE